MKYIKYLFIVLILAAGCGEKKSGIEVIPNYDEIYKPASELKMSPKIETGNEFLQTAEFKDLLNKLWKSDSTDFPRIVKYKLYVNEEGKIDKVILQSEKKMQELDNYIVKKLENVKFSIVEKEGKKVKFSYDWGIELPVNLTEPFITINVDDTPMPVGGMAALAQNIKYPEKAKIDGIEGKVFIKALIDENGNVYKTTVIKGVSPELDEAASESIKRTKFTPGMLKDKPVKTAVTIPVSFVLKNKE